MLTFDFIQAPVAVRLGALLEVLGSNESVLAPVPFHLKLAVAVTGFWLREVTPKPPQPHLQALLLGMVYGELTWNNQPGATHSQHGGYFFPTWLKKLKCSCNNKANSHLSII